MSYKIVIPARFASSRLPGKPLLPIAGKPMIEHVYERAKQSSADEVVIATDDERIYEVATSFGAKVVMTSENHENGTDRIAEVAQICGWDDEQIIVNLQGDEPLMPTELVEQVVQSLIQNTQAGMSSVCAPIINADDFFNPNIVKVVLNQEGFALYFSRAPIPFDRQLNLENTKSISDKLPSYRHIGMYAYRAVFLKQYQNMQVAGVEQAECLEQLRALWYGVKIHMSVTQEVPAHGVDTQADLERIESILAEQKV